MTNTKEQALPTSPKARPVSPSRKTYNIEELEVLQDYLQSLAVPNQHLDRSHTPTPEDEPEVPASEPSAAEMRNPSSDASTSPSTSALDSISLDADERDTCAEALESHFLDEKPATANPTLNEFPTPESENALKDNDVLASAIPDAPKISQYTDSHAFNSEDSSSSKRTQPSNKSLFT